MTAGIPGVGIGGIFYIASALLMPMRSLVAVARGRPDEARWALALRQAGIAAAILATLWVTGIVLGWIITSFIPQGAAIVSDGSGGTEVRSVVKAGALLLSLGTLSVVLALVQVARVALPVRATPSNPEMSRAVRTRPAA